MVLTFPTIEDIKSMIKGPEVNWLGNFFEEFREWSPNFVIDAFCHV